MVEKRLQLSPYQIWMLACRPKTLPAAVSGVIVGTAVALREGKFQAGPALAALLGALLLQVGANLSNDLFDYYRGADTSERVGPLRVTQSGLLSPRQVQAGMLTVFGVAVLVGLYLTWIAGWPVVLMGSASILAALAYTGGPLPFGYYGLGDLFVFIFFGMVAVCGTYFVQAGSLSPLATWAAIPMGCLITALLDVNNLRDIDTDRTAGKKTLAVRFGAGWARSEYLLCLVGAYAVPIALTGLRLASPWCLLAFGSIPLAVRIYNTLRTQKGRALNQALAATGQLTLVYGLLFSLGLLIA